MTDVPPPDEGPPELAGKSARKTVRKTIGNEVARVAYISFHEDEPRSSSDMQTGSGPGVAIATPKIGISNQEEPAEKRVRKTPEKQQAPKTSKGGSTPALSNTGASGFPAQPTNPQVPSHVYSQFSPAPVTQAPPHSYSQFGPPPAQALPHTYSQFAPFAPSPTPQGFRPQTGSGGQRPNLPSINPNQASRVSAPQTGQTGLGRQGLDLSSLPPHQRALYTEQVVRARQAQQQAQAQPNSFTQQAHVSQNSAGAPQIHFNNPNFGPPVAFQAGSSQQHNHPGQPQEQSFAQSPHPQQRAPASRATLTQEQLAYQAQLYHELQTRSGAEFVNSLTGGVPLPHPSNPSFARSQQPPQYHPQRARQTLQNPLQRPPQHHPQQRPQQSLQQPSGPRPLRRPQPGTMSSNPFQRGAAHGRHDSMGNMAGPSMSSGSMAQNQLGGPAMSPQSSQQSNDDKRPEAAILPRELNELTPDSMDPEEIDGYTISHEQDAGDGWQFANADETKALLEAMSADMELQGADTVALEPLDGVDPAQLKRESVPFVKSSIFSDESATMADTWGSLGGSPVEPREVVMSHQNRTLTWQEIVDTVERLQKEGPKPTGVAQFPGIPSTVPGEEFMLFPNWIIMMGWEIIHKDRAALERVPTSGLINQYIPRAIDTMVWYNQIIFLRSHVDLWLPQPLNYMFAWFQDTPYGIAHRVKDPALIQPIMQEGTEYEFTQHEAQSLAHITMTRFRAGLDSKPVSSLALNQIVFKHVHGWAPTLERMQVLDLMYQIDLVYWYQGLTPRALHPYTKYHRNAKMINEKLSEIALNDGP